MRAGVWTVAVVAAGLGLMVALAGWVGGSGGTGPAPAMRVQKAPSDGEPRTGLADKDEAIPPWADVELVVHRVVPRTRGFRGDGYSILATRDEAAMLDGVRIDGKPLEPSLGGPRIWFTLVNHTDRGYLISDRTLRNMLIGGVRFVDGQQRAYGFPPTGFISYGDEEVYSVPLAPGGRRNIVMALPLTRMQLVAEPEPLVRPGRPAEAILRVRSLDYAAAEACKVLARPIEGNRLGQPLELRVYGEGTCEVRFDGPM